MNNKIVKLVAFCMAVTLMIFSPAICSLGFNVYLGISMKSTGSLPTVKTQAKLDKLLDYRSDSVWINTGVSKPTSSSSPFFSAMNNDIAFGEAYTYTK